MSVAKKIKKILPHKKSHKKNHDWELSVTTYRRVHPEQQESEKAEPLAASTEDLTAEDAAMAMLGLGTIALLGGLGLAMAAEMDD